MHIDLMIFVFIFFGISPIILWLDKANTEDCKKHCIDKDYKIEDLKCYCKEGNDWIFRYKFKF